MSASSPRHGSPDEADLSDEQVLKLLDLATEVLEGLDELGITTRTELLSLMNRLERRVADES